MKLTISHPHGSLFSYHAARAMSDQNVLRSFRSGVVHHGAVAKVAKYLPSGAKDRLLNREFEKIPQHTLRPHYLWETISRLGKRLKTGGPTPEVRWYDVLFCGHDLQVSRALETGLDAVYAYEDGARRTFEAAKRQGAVTVYELPLGYYQGVAFELERAQGERPALPLNFKAEPLWKQRRKNAELDLADVVVVPCNWASESLRHSRGVNGKPIITVPYGTPALEVVPRSLQPGGPFTILFAGQVGLRKGVPHLIEAWERLGLKDARLLLAGSMNLGPDYLKSHGESFEYLGALPRVQLLKLMEDADLFVFPSLAEGFGLVIGEAMAAGVPVLTTVNTGGYELITDGKEGWCIPAHDVESLMERIEWAYHHRDELYQMGKLARQRAEQWTWADYRRKLIEELSSHLSFNRN